jgi:hypothetical protein
MSRATASVERNSTMSRKVFDKIASVGGIIAVVVLLVAGVS